MEKRLAGWASPLIAVGGIVLLLVLAVFLVNREDASSVAAAAETAMVADNALGVATAVRSASGYALGFAAATEFGPGTNELLDNVRASAQELGIRVSRLASRLDPEIATEIEGASALVSDSATQLMVDLRTRNGNAAETHTALTEGLDSLSDALIEIRDDNVAEVLIAGEGVGRVATAVRFLVLFVIPLAIVVSLWRIQRRSSERKVLAAEVEKQRHIVESKDEFVADVSHELRTPLTGIYGFAVALEENSDGMDEFQKEMVDLIITESAELSRMVDDLVALGRIDAGAVTYVMGEVDVQEAIEQVITPFRRLGISFEHDSEGLAVHADGARFRQILRNLLSNAVKYGNGDVAVAAFDNGPTTVVEVLDDGPGVPDEVVDRLFERYIHTDGTAVLEGSVGLGLAIARSLAEGMGGHLSYSRVGDLTVFSLELRTFAYGETPDDEGVIEVSGTEEPVLEIESRAV